MEKPTYQRVLLKISGEALAGAPGRGIDFAFARQVCQVVQDCVRHGVQVGLVVGGGNFWRGVKDGGGRMERARADQMGMLATVINSLALQDVLEQLGQPARVLTSIPMGPVGEIHSQPVADRYLREGKVVLFAGGTGNPYFSTDTTITLRAIEMDADCILLAKAIDGVYDSDPRINPAAKKYDTVSIQEVIDKQLAVVDLTASIMCMEHKMPMAVFSLNEENGIANAMQGNINGTIVTVS